MSGLWLGSYLALWAVVLVELATIAILFRQLGLRLLNSAAGISRSGIAVGRQAPSVTGLDEDWKTVDLDAGSLQRSIILFAATGCVPCARLMPDLALFAQRNPDVVIRVVTPDSVDANRRFAAEHSITMPVINASEANERFEVKATPFAFVIDQTGRVAAKGLVNRYDDLDRLAAFVSDGQPNQQSSPANKRRLNSD